MLRVSRKMAQGLGFSDPAELVGKTDIELYGDAFGQKTRRDDVKIMENEPADHRPDREPPAGRRPGELDATSKMPLHDELGNVIGLAGITHEINEIRQTEMALQHLATHDPLTDLPNRFLMEDG